MDKSLTCCLASVGENQTNSVLQQSKEIIMPI